MENNKLDKEKLEEEKEQKEVQMIHDEETRRTRESFRGSSGYKFVMEVFDSEIASLDSLSSFKLNRNDTESSIVAILAQQEAIRILKNIKKRIR